MKNINLGIFLEETASSLTKGGTGIYVEAPFGHMPPDK